MWVLIKSGIPTAAEDHDGREAEGQQRPGRGLGDDGECEVIAVAADITRLKPVRPYGECRAFREAGEHSGNCRARGVVDGDEDCVLRDCAAAEVGKVEHAAGSQREAVGEDLVGCKRAAVQLEVVGRGVCEAQAAGGRECAGVEGAGRQEAPAADGERASDCAGSTDGGSSGDARAAASTQSAIDEKGAGSDRLGTGHVDGRSRSNIA